MSVVVSARTLSCFAAALSLSWFALVPAAHAQDRSAEVKKIVEEAIFAMTPGGPNVFDLRWDGPVTVKPEGGRYAVDLPILRLTGPDKERVELKGATLEMTPAEADRWRVEYRLPSPVRVQARDGKLIGVLSFAGQRFTGLWAQSVKSFVETDGELRDIAFGLATGERPFTLANLTSRRRYVEGKPGQWSGPDNTRIEKLALNDVGGVSMRLENASLDSSVTGFNIAAAAKLAEQVRLTSAEPPAPKKAKGKQAQKAPKRDVKAIRQALKDLPIPLTAASAAFRIGGFATKTDEGGFALEQALYETAIEGLDREKSTARLAYSHQGATVVPPPTLPDFTPKTTELRLRLSNLPNAQLWRALRDFIGDMAEREIDAAAAIMAEKMPDMLSNAGLELGLDAFKIDMTEAAADMSGVAVVEKNAAFGVVAGFNLALTGLDAVIKLLREGGSPDEDVAKVMLPILTIIQAMGQQGEPDKGRSVRRYRFELGADGQMLLNGTDMSQLAAGFGGKEEKPAPTPKQPAPKKR